MNTILVTTSTFATFNPLLLDNLNLMGFRIVLNPFGRKINENELRTLLEENKPVGMLAGTEAITRSILETSKAYLRVISRVGVGWDNVDRTAAKEFGIAVCRTEGVLDQAVAELTIGLMLSALRSINSQDRQIRDGIWQKHMGGLLQGKAVGIIGFGAIGRRVGELAKAFGSKILYYDPVPKKVAWAQAVALSELLQNSDIISLHASGSDLILGEKEINSLCKKGVIIINMARGGLVDEKALSRALQSGQVEFACLDVFENEPYKGPLIELENVIFTPHIGSYAREARIDMEEMAVTNLLEGLKHVQTTA